MSQDSAPTTLPDFHRMFSDDAACADFLFGLRYPDGYACPACGSTKAWPAGPLREMICDSGHRVSITAGTLMHRTRQPLRTWFHAAFLVSTLTPGISAVQFQRQLGLTRYETAFQMLHKLRSGLVDPERTPLAGEVEVDELYVGGVEEGRPGRGALDKALVIGGVEVVRYEGKGKDGSLVEKMRAGRVRLNVIPDAAATTLVPWVQRNVAPASKVVTDGNASYNRLGSLGYAHEQVLATHKREKTGHYLPLVHLIVSNLKRWLLGTHKGAVLPKHLQAYLNEYTFRFNRRFWRGPAFTRALGLAVNADAWPEYDTLYATGKDEGWEHPDSRPSAVATR